MGLIELEAVRRVRVRQLFLARPFEQTETAALLFYRWLEQHHPELLPRGKVTRIQHLRVDLEGLYK